MTPLSRLLSPRRWTGETYETAGFPLSRGALRGSVTVMVAALTIELPLLFMVVVGPLLFGIGGWHVALLIPARLLGIYGLILTQRQRPLFLHTWMDGPFTRMIDLWWAWTIPLVIVAVSTLFFLIAPLIQTETNTETLLSVITILAWLTLLSMTPTWFWCSLQTILLFQNTKQTSRNQYRHGQ